MQNALDLIAARLQRAERVLFITGAGMSADSGLPTYRGIGGLYDGELTEDGIPIEEALSGSMMQHRPEIAWKYLLQIEQSCRSAGFNRGHRILAEIEAEKPGTWVLTQNIDGFHHAAGSRQVIEIHGRFGELYCVSCDYREQVKDYSGIHHLPPACPHCGGLVRPAVVLFEEMLPAPATASLYQELSEGFELVFSIGTTSLFPYIAQPLLEGREQGALTVEINPSVTAVSAYVDYKLPAGAAEILEKLWQRCQRRG